MYTGSRSWRNVKLGITGSSNAVPGGSVDEVDKERQQDPTHISGESDKEYAELCSEQNLLMDKTEKGKNSS